MLAVCERRISKYDSVLELMILCPELAIIWRQRVSWKLAWRLLVERGREHALSRCLEDHEGSVTTRRHLMLEQEKNIKKFILKRNKEGPCCYEQSDGCSVRRRNTKQKIRRTPVMIDDTRIDRRI
ncbi:hypothetical protein TNIN_24911 [Trichonephila inaurata madagascariensis]|uniref:Uncharacterized protein n=1 Tax=Trichonephila inaurata madagascariensis TaxID=2747483 RepID=A0A8X6X1V7_9ARAC|nr:hypothetical protein TNIN_24911 [Trichonephila inaurata madagascariensis]